MDNLICQTGVSKFRKYFNTSLESNLCVIGKVKLGFKVLGLASPLLKILERQGLVKPTPIQRGAIPIILEGRDVIGLAQTGTGKSIAYILPLLNFLYKSERKGKFRPVRGLILSPTRELAKQVDEVIKPYSSGVNLKSVPIYGGIPIFKQVHALKRGSDIIVGTPGRIEDHISKGTIDLSRVEFLVIDEADQMLDIGFLPAINRLCSLLPLTRQTLLFSATMPKEVKSLTENYLRNPKEVVISSRVKTAKNIDQKIIFLSIKEKPFELKKILKDNPEKRVLIFLKTKHFADKLVKLLNQSNFNSDAIHGNKSQAQRERALKAFRDGKRLILLATDVASRGLDVPNVELVINFDLPSVPENYIHRIGRTARAGKSGEAISFCSPSDKKNLISIERHINQNLQKVFVDKRGVKADNYEPTTEIQKSFRKIKKGKLVNVKKSDLNKKNRRFLKEKSRRLVKVVL